MNSMTWSEARPFSPPLALLLPLLPSIPPTLPPTPTKSTAAQPVARAFPAPNTSSAIKLDVSRLPGPCRTPDVHFLTRLTPIKDTGAKPFSCIFCDRDFSRKWASPFIPPSASVSILIDSRDRLQTHYNHCQRRGDRPLPNSIPKGRKPHACVTVSPP